MIELEPYDFSKIRSLARQPHLVLAVDAIGARNSPAMVWVDDRAKTRAAYLWDKTHCHFLLGDAPTPVFVEAVRELIREEIAPQASAPGKNFAKVYYASTAWEEQVRSIFDTVELVQGERVFHALDHVARPDWRASVPSGFMMRQIDASLLASRRVRGIEDLRHEIITGWNSETDFLTSGFGFCLLCGDEIVTWCTAECVSRGKCGVGIKTAVKHMRRGFATLTASALVEHAVAQGITPHWDSWKANLPSLAVAQKVGFRPVSEYTVFTGRFRGSTGPVVQP